MTRFTLPRLLLVFALLAAVASSQNPTPQEPQKEKRGIGVGTASPSPTPTSVTSAQSGAVKPEIVLQPGITSPQTEVRFSPDGRLLASVGWDGNSIKLWEIASGRLLRTLQSSVPSMGASSQRRPFRFSVDGKTLIAFADGRLRRWEIETGRELGNTFLANARESFQTLMSDDARLLVTLSLDNSKLTLWDLTSGVKLRTIEFADHEQLEGQDSIALSADGKLLAAFTSLQNFSKNQIEHKTQAVIFDTASGRRVQSLKYAENKVAVGVVPDVDDQVSSVAFGADASWLAVRTKNLMKIWEVASGKEIRSFTPPALVGPKSQPGLAMFGSRFLFSPDKQTLAVVSDASNLNLTDPVSGSTQRTIQAHNGNIVAIGFSSDGKLLASSSVDNQIKLWDVASGREVRTFKGAAMPVSDLVFSRDGKSLIMAGQQAVSVWELTNGGVRRSVLIDDDYTHRAKDLWEHGPSLSTNGASLIAGSNSRPLAKVWDTNTGKELREINLAESKQLGNSAFSADGSMIAFVEKKSQKPGPPQAATPAATPPMVAMPDMTKLMEMARKDPKKMQEQMKKVQDAMNKGDLGAGVEMMQNMGMMPGSSSPNKPPNKLQIIEVASGKQLQAIPLPSGFINEIAGDSIMSSSTMAFSPDGQVLASASGFAGSIVLTDTRSGAELRSLKTGGMTVSVNALAWSQDGKRLASAHWGFNRNLMDPNAANDFSFEDISFSVKVWDASTGTELVTLPGHKNFITRLIFSPDGRTIASGSFDNTVKLWDVATGRELRTLTGHTGSITGLAFTPDARFLASGSDDGSTRIWNTATGELLATMVSVNQGQDWLVVTPDGLFDGSPGGWDQILWRFSPAVFDVVPVEIFFSEYFYPGLLTDILTGHKPTAPTDISRKDRRQPRLTIESSVAPGGSATERTLKVKINVAESPAGARDVRLFRNGSLVKVWHGDAAVGQTFETDVNLVAGTNELTAYAFNRDNVKSSDAKLSIKGTDSLRRPATFHLLVVGVNEYSNAAYNLKYAAADARAFAEEVERQQRKLGRYTQFEVAALLDQNATKANLIYALNRLGGASEPPPIPDLGKITASQPEDAVVIFFAGHGTAQQQRFYLIPHDLGYQGQRTELDAAGLKEILAHSVSDLELERALEGIDAGEMSMIIDACNSGQALEAEEKRRGPMNSKGLAQLAYEKGVYILTAAQSYQAALEAEQLGHGYLTYALVEEGLKSAAADTEPADGEVMLREWFDYATNRVPAMQQQKMRAARDIKLEIAFVEGEEKKQVDERNVQRPRVFYRREPEAVPLIVAQPK
ncbi:MAG TPA: caspase family protein [Pyrinomonadaceae bacterium]|nr:caspase family protein [Pyrinomonadaceae bacterium]